MDRWREHFQELLNRPSCADPDVVTKIPQRPVVHEMDNPPTVDEIRKAIAHLRSGKAPGQDGIPPEIYKVAETTITPRLHALFIQLWAEGGVPQDFKDAQITCIYKKKGDRSDCNNYRGISLLSIAGKILARVLLERLKLHITEGNISESQTGFRSNRGTTDCIFTIRMIQEKCRCSTSKWYTMVNWTASCVQAKLQRISEEQDPQSWCA